MKKNENKELSLRGGLISDEAIFQAETNSVQRLLSRRCKNVEDWLCSCVASSLCRVSAMHFLAMTIPTIALTAVLSFGVVSESWAITCPSGTQGSDSSSDTSKYCGVNCCWGIDSNNVLTITPAINTATGKPYTNVTMADFNYKAGNTTTDHSTDAPWGRQGATSVVVENGIKNIGKFAFQGEKITSVAGMENVTRIGDNAFSYAKMQSIDMPNVTTIGDHAFGNARSLQNVYMPKVTSIGSWGFDWALKLTDVTILASASINQAAFNYVPTLTDVNCLGTEAQCNSLKSRMESKGAKFAGGAFHIITTPTPNCGGYSKGVCTTCASGYHSADNSCVANPPNCKVFAGDDCSECLTGYLTKENSCVEPSSCTGEYLISGNECIKMPGCLDFANGACGGCETGYYKKDGGCVAATDGCGDGYLKKGTSCISAAQGCGSSFRLNDGECDRIRYTPAEAAEVLKDTDNEIIMTFKVNR
ncbi:MAG: leucine-rich repeat protein [Alphaproteobacteria bacterium]|nr:leucine-rich repeat protein [Alphaproteobacteria bacterium]